MKKYIAFFRLRFSMGLQYRAAALAGVVTQFVWGAMEILVFRAFYQSGGTQFPMDFAAVSSYVWMQQAFLALFMAWLMENEIFDSIRNGNVAYELCRPIRIYDMWFARSVANRLSRAVLRCVPILGVAVLLPYPFGLSLPKDIKALGLFFVTLVMGLFVTVAFCMLVYIATFFMMSPAGIRMVAVSTVEFLSGGVIPLPFFPAGVRRVMELLPFASMQNVPLRIYSGDLAGKPMWEAILLQGFWLFALIGLGRLLNYAAMKKVTIQGG